MRMAGEADPVLTLTPRDVSAWKSSPHPGMKWGDLKNHRSMRMMNSVNTWISCIVILPSSLCLSLITFMARSSFSGLRASSLSGDQDWSFCSQSQAIIVHINIQGIAKAIQEAKVRPVSGPKFLFKLSGTTRLGGDPVTTPVPPIFEA